MTQLIPLLTQQGIRIGVIKHSHHDFELDQPGKDSYELHHAGASQTLLISKYRSALITENPELKEPKLSEAIAQLELTHIDLVLIEGFRHEADLLRIELHRPSMGRPFLFPGQKNIIAVASDENIEIPLPLLDLNNPQQIADFIVNHV